MIKLGATNKDGGKILFLGLSEGNLMLLRRGRPIKIIGSEVGCSHDICIFWGETEAAMVEELLGHGVKLPDEVKIHHDDDRQEGGEH